MNKRFDSFRKLLQENNLDGAFIYGPQNRRYLSGFTGSTGYVVLSMDKAGFVTDFRYKEQAEMQCKGFDIYIHTNTPSNTLIDVIKNTVQSYGITRLGIEDSFMTVAFFENLKRSLESVELIPLKDMPDVIRMIKEPEEIANIEKASALADAAFKHILGFIKPGMSEKEVALEMEYFMRKNGATAASFDFIVASGVRSSLPHGVASDKIINEGEFLTMDFGCVYNGYCSDMTRTIFIGKASEKHKHIYETVLHAQLEALKYIKPGILGKEVDKIARDIIKDAGFGEYFGHGLGHGVGLAVHEEPRLGLTGERMLQAGMAVTNEPGIYIPDFGGVRIEDLVLVTEDGCKVLNSSPKELIEL